MLLSPAAELLFANERAVRLFSGSTLAPAAWLSLESIRVDFMPDAWRQDIRDIFLRLYAGESNLVLRTIWYGVQVFSSATLLDSMPTIARDVGPHSALRTPGQTGPVMLLTSRQVARQCAQGLYDASHVTIVQSRVAHLGPLAALTERELQVLAILGDGGTLKAAAERLHRSEKTIDAHRSAIHHKLGITDRVQLAAISQTLGLTVDDIHRMVVAGILKK